LTTVLKLGGELLEDAPGLTAMARATGALAAAGPLVVVHGGGRAIDAELRLRGLEPKFADGLRITDAAALQTVISVLAGRTNTAFVAALHAAGVKAVGLTGADAGIGLSRQVDQFTTSAGEPVDLELVGEPVNGSMALLQDLTRLGYVPVVASIGVTESGGLLNVNADTLAGHLAGALGARRLVIAGGTAGVLDERGKTIASLNADGVAAMIASGTAHSGMIAKLTACRHAMTGGVEEVAIVSGRGVANFNQATGTRLVAAVRT